MLITRNNGSGRHIFFVTRVQACGDLEIEGGRVSKNMKRGMCGWVSRCVILVLSLFYDKYRDLNLKLKIRGI